MIRLSSITYTYPNSQTPVLSNLSLSLKVKDCVALLGRNGCGKSTVFKILSGSIKPNFGTVHAPHHKEIAFLDQHIHANLFSELTLTEHLRLLRMRFSSPKAESDYFGSYHPQLPQRMNLPVSLLSGGQKQAFAMALTLYHPKRLLLLDEPTSALDPQTSVNLMKRLYSYIDQHACATLLCTHDLTQLRAPINRVMGLKSGRLVFEKSDIHTLDTEILGRIYAP